MDSKIESIILQIKKMRGLAPHSLLVLQQSRLDICNSNDCGALKVDFGIKRCGLCQCILELKTLVPTEHCKINKW